MSDSPPGRFTARIPEVVEDPGALRRADGVLVAVKAWQVAGVAPALLPLVEGGGVVVPLQNGVEAAGRLAAALGEERVAGGLVAVLSWIDGPGAVKHVGMSPRIRMGEHGARGGAASARLEALADALRRAGAEVEGVRDVESATWEKFLLIEPWGAVAAARAPVGVVRSVAVKKPPGCEGVAPPAAAASTAGLARRRTPTAPEPAVAFGSPPRDDGRPRARRGARARRAEGA